MNEITLTSARYKITAVKRKTRAKTFADWRVGDEIQLSTDIEYKGGGYASYFRAENLTQGTSVRKSQSELSYLLRSVFELEPVTEPQLAEVIPFPNAVADVLEAWAAAARRGEITGVIIAGLGSDRLEGDTLTAAVNVNSREYGVLVNDLNDSRIIETVDVNLFE
ncbi:hypothetical protein ABH892_004469 [Paenibacillus sp. RC254]|uniref:hypothetical protein n=1 Tax=unclassified Paenibacillus TaxID=185978 RepID=UPI0024BABE07|nr:MULTISPECIES: hypothetical protein [unclassified Paenibacillus]